MSDVKKIAETAVKKAEVGKKLESAQRKLDTQVGMLNTRLSKGQEIGTKAIDVKYAANEVKRLQKAYDQLK